MIKLLNSAMMPVPGVYQMIPIPRADFAAMLKEEPFESFIGYPDTAQLIEEIAGVKVPLSREQTTVRGGDVMLICRLKYRVQNPSDKGKFQPSAEDFEFFRCDYISA